MKHASFNQFSVDAARSLDLSSRLPSCHCGDVLRVSLNRKRLRDILRNNVVDTAAHETQPRMRHSCATRQSQSHSVRVLASPATNRQPLIRSRPEHESVMTIELKQLSQCHARPPYVSPHWPTHSMRLFADALLPKYYLRRANTAVPVIMVVPVRTVLRGHCTIHAFGGPGYVLVLSSDYSTI